MSTHANVLHFSYEYTVNHGYKSNGYKSMNIHIINKPNNFNSNHVQAAHNKQKSRQNGKKLHFLMPLCPPVLNQG